MSTISALAVLAALLIACGGVSQTDFDAAKQSLAAQDQKVAALQQQLSAKEKEVSEAAKKLGDKDKELAEAKKSGGQTGVTTLLGAQKLPTPTPPPPPTALPAGVPTNTPAPPRSAPASYLDQPSVIIYVETLATTRVSTLGVAATVNCTNSNIFKRGQRIVWRFEVYDPTTGKRLTSLDGATIIVRMPNGNEGKASWSQRGGGAVPDAPWMWNTTWDIPLDYPLGTLDYSINVAYKDGRTATWKQPGLKNTASGLDTRLQIVE